MCIISLVYKLDSKYPILFGANRDEFYERDAMQMHWWEDGNILAGKDQQAGGTWFGINKKGHWASVTNIRYLPMHRKDAASRGEIIPEFLNKEESTLMFLKALKIKSEDYNPFNVFLYDGVDLFYFNNIHRVFRKLTPGLYTLSNAYLSSAWPKTKKLGEGTKRILANNNLEAEDFFKILADKERAPKPELPNTGVGEEMEEMLSSVFIESPKYGTRCSTYMRIDKNEQLEVWEKTYVPQIDEDLCYFNLAK